MARGKAFHVLIATDGSTAAREATKTALNFPWPDRAEVSAIVARDVRSDYRRSTVLALLDRSSDIVAARERRRLSRRWPDASVRVADAAAVDAIITEAKRVRAAVIVMGWRGYGALRRMLAGSVSRGVIRRAPCAVLVARRAPKQVRSFLIGVDGSAHAKHAVQLIASLPAPPGGRVRVVSAVEMMRLPTHVHLTTATRGDVQAEVERVNRKRLAKARSVLQQAQRVLQAGGWNVHLELTRGAPLSDLMDIVTRTRADVLVVGARGCTAIDRLILGSVAEGALNRSPVPVLVVP